MSVQTTCSTFQRRSSLKVGALPGVEQPGEVDALKQSAADVLKRQLDDNLSPTADKNTGSPVKNGLS